MGRWVGRFIYHVQQDEGSGESGIYSFFEPGIGRCAVLRQFDPVSNPDGSTLMRLCTTDEAYARVVLEKEKLEQARKGIPWRNMKRYEVYSKL